MDIKNYTKVSILKRIFGPVMDFFEANGIPGFFVPFILGMIIIIIGLWGPIFKKKTFERKHWYLVVSAIGMTIALVIGLIQGF